MEFIVQHEDFDANKLQVTKPKNKKGNDGKNRFSAFLNYNKQRYLYPATPLLKAPFGASDFNGDGKFKMQLSIEAADSDEEKSCAAWLDQLRAVDEAMIEWGIANWEEIPCFKKKPSREMAEEKYSGIVKEPEEGSTYAPKLKCSFGMTRWHKNLKDENDEPIAEEDFASEPNFEVYSSTGEQIQIKDVSELPTVIPKGSLVRLCFQLKIWSLPATGYGLSLSALTLQVTASNFEKPKGNIWAEASSAPAVDEDTGVVDSDGEEEPVDSDAEEDDGEDEDYDDDDDDE